MSDVTDAQGIAAVNAHLDAAANTPGSTTTGSHTAAAVVFVSGTAQQIDKLKDASLYINVTNAATALAVAIGPTASTTVTLNASQTDALGLVNVLVPGGWFVKLTGTMANVACTSILF
jgi:hypothetical protein